MLPLAQHFGRQAGYTPQDLSPDLGRQLILDTVEPVSGVECVPLREALGRILARPVISPIDVPPHDNSAMDGYGLRSADLAAQAETHLKVVGQVLAGHPLDTRIGPGQAVRIMTGARLPAGVDTVVMQERVRLDGDTVIIPAGQHGGQNTRRQGEELRAGQPALAAGKLLRPAELGLVASLGTGEVIVRRRLRVAMFSTGDEVASVGTPIQPGQIYDSNRYTLFGMLTRLGCEVIDLGLIPDVPETLEATLQEAAAMADVVITSGGVSVGDADFTRVLLERLGEVLFWKVAMKPGRPMAFGRIDQGTGGAWLFGLPGNPVAAMVTFYQLVRPALLRLAGMDPVPAPVLLQVPCQSPLRKNPGRTEYLRGVLATDGTGWTVRPTGGQGSAMLSSMAEANCFIVLDARQGNVSAGETVSVQILDGIV
ncbi:gephyrin-like molybdotransferase Glp [Zoogloea sp.]|uniref:molybdopterin molybdotransferase MoeA n=1 Tax=Zoogloea sp. TaxID=49181 RepID=UPI0026046793|nr:gephyrin-like molybdotransferase Glp [Zoogloea sp.]MDD3354346.1 molybdopterin-binding protein [Zoogloea sp.]